MFSQIRYCVLRIPLVIHRLIACTNCAHVKSLQTKEKREPVPAVHPPWYPFRDGGHRSLSIGLWHVGRQFFVSIDRP
jgi:hypothetical protein